MDTSENYPGRHILGMMLTVLFPFSLAATDQTDKINSIEQPGRPADSTILDLILPDQTELLRDTVYNYGYHLTFPDSSYEEHLSSRTTYFYDCKLNLVSELRESPGSEWTPSQLKEYQYDEKGRTTETLTFSWFADSSKWRLDSKEIRKYDSLDREYERSTYGYDPASPGLIRLQGMKWDRLYNPDSTTHEAIRSYFNYPPGEWIIVEKSTYGYMPNRFISYIVEQQYDPAAGEWLNDERVQYFYDLDDQLDRVVTETWDDQKSDWINAGRTSYVYDASGNQTRELHESWDTLKLEWINASRYLYEWEGQLHWKTEAYQRWDTTSGSWKEMTNTSYDFDDYGNLLQYHRVQLAMNGDTNYILDSQYEHDYTAGSTNIMYNFYTDGEWIPSSRRMEKYASEDDLNILDRVYEDEELCVVTVSEDNRNLLVWEKTPDKGTIAYNIYREGDVADEYEYIGTRSYDDLSIFVDPDSDPREEAYRYKITTVNECSESEYSNYHQTIHLQISPGIGRFNLTWTKYEYEGGPLTFITHEIYRGGTTASMTKIGSVSGNQFTYTDVNPPGDTLYYQVRGILATPCFPTEGKKADPESYAFSRSNIEDIRTTTGLIMPGAGLQELRIHPNPVRHTAVISIPESSPGIYKLVLMDIRGRVIRSIDNISKPEYELLRGDLPGGFYLIRLTGPKVYQGKLVVD
jgi:hypothetical protein